MLLSCSQPRQHIFLSDVLFPFIIPNLEQSWHFYCVIIFYGLSSPFALHLAERRIPKPVLWISLLPKKIDRKTVKVGSGGGTSIHRLEFPSLTSLCMWHVVKLFVDIGCFHHDFSLLLCHGDEWRQQIVSPLPATSQQIVMPAWALRKLP